ncbi:MAG: ATP-binding protein [Myxococcales bacterium]|nr:ATP-binding protein [Myxococcales bacterium]
MKPAPSPSDAPKQRLGHDSLRARIIALPYTVILLLIVAASSTWFQMRAVERELDDISAAFLPRAILVSRLIQNTLEKRAAILNYRQTRGEFDLERVEALSLQGNRLLHSAHELADDQGTPRQLHRLADLRATHDRAFWSELAPATHRAVHAAAAIADTHGPALERALIDISVTAQRQNEPQTAAVALETTRHVTRVISSTSRYMSTGDSTDADRAAMELAAVRNGLDELRTRAARPSHIRWLRHANQELLQLDEQLAQAIWSVRKRDAVLHDRLRPLEEAIMSTAAQLQDEARQRLATRTTGAQEATSTTIFTFVALIALSVGGIVYLGRRLHQAYSSHLEERRLAEGYLQRLLQASPIGLLVVAPDGTIERANQALTELMGYSERELLGKPVELLVPVQQRTEHESRRRLLVNQQVDRAMGAGRKVTGLRRDGTEVPIDVRLTTTTLQGRPVVLAGVLDRTEHTRAEAARRRLETEIAHAAGMAEIATGVLHNVGNVVNSVNISVEVAQDGLRNTSLAVLGKVVELLDSHSSDPQSLLVFLTEDARGRRVIESLKAITLQLRKEHLDLNDELQMLNEHVRHIIAIVTSQQEYARSTSVLENVELRPLLDKAIALSGAEASNNRIQIERAYEGPQDLTVEPHKLMQILVNLLTNARHATERNDPDNRIIRVTTSYTDEVVISVVDNGIGISAEDLTRIFTHGFTTKRENGHGFGLHISATTAMELGGRLTAISDGPGKGATFQLQLPTRPSRAA